MENAYLISFCFTSVCGTRTETTDHRRNIWGTSVFSRSRCIRTVWLQHVVLDQTTIPVWRWSEPRLLLATRCRLHTVCSVTINTTSRYTVLWQHFQYNTTSPDCFSTNYYKINRGKYLKLILLYTYIIYYNYFFSFSTITNYNKHIFFSYNYSFFFHTLSVQNLTYES